MARIMANSAFFIHHIASIHARQVTAQLIAFAINWGYIAVAHCTIHIHIMKFSGMRTTFEQRSNNEPHNEGATNE